MANRELLPRKWEHRTSEYLNGFMDFHLGLKRKDNPYNTFARKEWDEGWRFAHQKEQERTKALILSFS